MESLVQVIAFFAPVIVITLFVLPSCVSLLRQRGLMGLAMLLALSVYTLGVMMLAAKTGLPYGKFVYDSALGYKLFGVVPWLVVVVYPSLLLATFWLASKFTLSGQRIGLAALFALVIGLMFDPVMVKLDFWQWDPLASGPRFYGVPLISFVGWLLVSAVGAALLHVMWGGDTSVKRGVAHSGLLLVLFWTGANFGIEQWIPAAIGGVIGGLMLLLAGIEKVGEHPFRGLTQQSS